MWLYSVKCNLRKGEEGEQSENKFLITMVMVKIPIENIKIFKCGYCRQCLSGWKGGGGGGGGGEGVYFSVSHHSQEHGLLLLNGTPLTCSRDIWSFDVPRNSTSLRLFLPDRLVHCTYAAYWYAFWRFLKTVCFCFFSSSCMVQSVAC